MILVITLISLTKGAPGRGFFITFFTGTGFAGDLGFGGGETKAGDGTFDVGGFIDSAGALGTVCANATVAKNRKPHTAAASFLFPPIYFCIFYFCICDSGPIAMRIAKPVHEHNDDE